MSRTAAPRLPRGCMCCASAAMILTALGSTTYMRFYFLQRSREGVMDGDGAVQIRIGASTLAGAWHLPSTSTQATETVLRVIYFECAAGETFDRVGQSSHSRAA